ncbi:unnamed protein product [Sphacelaria rigidula]
MLSRAKFRHCAVGIISLLLASPAEGQVACTSTASCLQPEICSIADNVCTACTNNTETACSFRTTPVRESDCCDDRLCVDTTGSETGNSLTCQLEGCTVNSAICGTTACCVNNVCLASGIASGNPSADVCQCTSGLRDSSSGLCVDPPTPTPVPTPAPVTPAPVTSSPVTPAPMTPPPVKPTPVKLLPDLRRGRRRRNGFRRRRRNRRRRNRRRRNRGRGRRDEKRKHHGHKDRRSDDH